MAASSEEPRLGRTEPDQRLGRTEPDQRLGRTEPDQRLGRTEPDQRLGRTTFRLPRTTYVVVVFLAACVWPFALAGPGATHGSTGPARVSLLTIVFVLPVLAVAFIARTATVVDDDGITARAVFGSRIMPWARIRGIAVRGNTILAVLEDGSVRLPCIHIAQLPALAEAAGSYLPDLPRPAPKQPPVRQRRR